MSDTTKSGPYWFDDMAVQDEPMDVERIGPRYCLPGRECEACGEREIHVELARYDVKVPAGLDDDTLSGEATLTRAEFAKLLTKFKVSAAVRKTLLPGTEVGKATFRIGGRQLDIGFDNLWPLVSERLVECVRAQGVRINTVEVKVVGRAKSLKHYFSLVPVIRNVMDPEWMKQEMEECPACRQWRSRPDIRLRKKVLLSKCHVVKSRWPARCGVVYSPDLEGLVYSPEFVQACLEAKLEGLGFRPGTWT